MPKDPTQSHAIYASDLLGFGNQVNAVTLNGLTADSFFRTDVSSFPQSDNTIDLGSPTSRIRSIYVSNLYGITSINGENLDMFMSRNKTNLPTVNSDGTTGFDLGGVNNFWRNIYAKQGIFTSLVVDSIVTTSGSKFSHRDLADIGVNTHPQIDAHINTKTVASSTASSNVHGATWNNQGNAIMARDASGDVWVRTLWGTANRANYADLAENYTTNEKADEGTIYCVSDNENYDVEICKEFNSHKVIGVVSSKPGYLMNAGIAGITLGLKGKLKVKVEGSVRKGDILVSSDLTPGVAKAFSRNELRYFWKIGIANETNTNIEIKLIDAIL